MGLDAQPIMPQLASSFYGFHHTVDSSLEVLGRLGVSASRITLRMAGLGWPDHWVVEQQPRAGSPLGPDVPVLLSVAGLGFFQRLPVGMWDKGGEAEPGTMEIVQVFDDPLQKAAHWVREGARLFDLRPDNYRACARWIALFGLDPAAWPRENTYHLALLLPNLHRLAGREEGINLALQLLLGLPLYEISRKPGWRYLERDAVGSLGADFARLGVDAVLSDRLEGLATLAIRIGPVSLETWRRFQQQENRRLLDAVLAFSVALHQDHEVSWLVLDPARPPRLGFEQQNARLGVNSHLGAPQPAAAG